jgi:hypothetical protein
MENLVNAALDLLWDFLAYMSVQVEENPKLSLEAASVIGFIAYMIYRSYRQAVIEAKGIGQFVAYKEVATKGTVVQTGTGVLVVLVAILSMLVILLLVFYMLGAN